MKETSLAQAALLTNPLINSHTQTINRLNQLLKTGSPANAQINAPAVSPTDIETALGPDNLAELQVHVAAAAASLAAKQQALVILTAPATPA